MSRDFTRPAAPAASAWGSLSQRDRWILESMLRKLGGSALDFDDASRALLEAVREEIPAGRIFLLGASERGPILGSLVSGVGIVAGIQGVTLIRIDPAGRRFELGDLWR